MKVNIKIQFLIPLFLISFQIYAQCMEDECGPPPMMSNYLCSDGIAMAGPGDCILNTVGQCYWEIITCPTITGYLRTIESSFCMDECSQYSIETEIDPGFGSINIIPGDFIIDGIDSYINRFVEVNLGVEVSCVECSAFVIEEISLSDDCQYPVDCFQDPCEVAEECQLNTPIECVANYCDGCYADYYDLNGNLVDCYGESICLGANPEGCFQNGCPDGYECVDDWVNSCVASSCICNEITEQWMCTDDCNGGSCIEEDLSGECGIYTACDDCTDSGCFWQPTDNGNCTEECMIEDLDCYGSTPNWVSECPESGSCTDLSELFFGWCDMALGVGYVDALCQHISGCGWDVDGVDYSGAFFNSLDECQETCGDGNTTCDEINIEYENLHSGEYLACDYDNECRAVWGDCDVGLGACHYSVNNENYPEDEINDLVDLWLVGDCMLWVCDCSAEPYAQCIDGSCIAAYCMSDNPAGCFQTGCDEDYECVVVPGECEPSWCACNGFYGDWYCTEDCGGGSCVAPALSGDLNDDGVINVMDVVLAVDAILHAEYNSMGDINGDGQLNVLDIVQLVDLIMTG
jgi:hypothetical protein